jgi:hypothetical protein
MAALTKTLTLTAKVSSEAELVLKVPEVFKGKTVEVQCTLKDKRDKVPRDEHGWPIGFWERVAGSIKDPKFKRYPQGEPDPPPSFE